MIVNGNRIEAKKDMWLVKDEVWSKLVYLSPSDSPENWRETTQAEYDEAHPLDIEELRDEDATIEDYENALGRFGV